MLLTGAAFAGRLLQGHEIDYVLLGLAGYELILGLTRRSVGSLDT